MKTIYCYPSRAAATLVRDAMSPKTNAKLWVEHKPVTESDKKRGVGEFAITTQETDIWASSKLQNCADKALQIALANALRKHEPDHPLCQIWHLKPENQTKGARYDIKG